MSFVYLNTISEKRLKINPECLLLKDIYEPEIKKYTHCTGFVVVDISTKQHIFNKSIVHAVG